MKTVILHDDGIGDIRVAVQKLSDRYKKKFKKDPKDVRLLIEIKRGPIAMKNGEWSKKLPYEDLTLNNNKVISYLKRDNLNWGILGYGDPKGGLKELMKFAKTKLNPKQLKGENQDLKITINESILIKREGEIMAKIVLTVPDKGLGGKDIQSPTLEKEGYLGINKWVEQAVKMLGNSTLDKAIKDIASKDKNLTDIININEINEPSEQAEENNSNKEEAFEALKKLGYKKGNITQVLQRTDNTKGTSEIVKEALTFLKKN